MPARSDIIATLGRRAVLATPLLLAGCTGWPKPRPGPMELLHLDAAGPHAAPTLLVMLPGAYSTPQEFVDEGFVAALRQRQLPVDVVVAGARVDHYIEGRVLQRIHDEVVAPARARGVQRVWLLGISLGGLFTLGYAARHPGQLDGALVLAPYLGRRTLLAQIDAAGGLQAWAQQPPQPDDLIEHDVWRWLARGGAAQGVHLGWGREDRFADAHQRLAALLPAGRSHAVPGGHDWPAWRTLWQQALDRGLMA